MKKKIVGVACAFALALSMSSVAFAANGSNDSTTWTAPSRDEAITLTKVYEVAGSTNPALYPAETLHFDVAVPEGVTNPDNPMIEVKDLDVAGNTSQIICINLPEYDTVGVYEYVISEIEGSTQGVVYTDATIAVKVLVSYDYTNKCLASQVVLSTTTDDANDSDGKVDTFTNKYNVGALTVAKTISGNLADDTVYFEMTVKFTAEDTVASAITVSGGSNVSNPTTIEASEWADGTVTKTINLKAGETLTFSNIPDGVTYEVVEAAKHILQSGETFSPNSNADKQYTVTYTAATGEIDTDETDAAVVNNHKATTVETAAALESMPFVVMLVAAGAGLAAFAVRRRQED